MPSGKSSAAEDMEHIEKNLSRLYSLAVESLNKVLDALTKGETIDLSAQAALADHLKDTINTETLFYIAKWQPLGHELLRAEAIIKVSYDLFRIVRYANEIARTTRVSKGLKAPDDILEGLSRTIEMVEKSFKAFIAMDKRLAKEVEELDEKIDKLYMKYLEKIASSDKVDREAALSCIIARQLERIADHSTYISREVARG